MTTLIQILFVLTSALILTSAVLVVTVRNIIHAALWLIASFFGVGMLYLLLEAEFVAVVQVLIYVGAISILILFAVMLTRHVDDERIQRLYQGWWAALLVAAGLFSALIVPTVLSFAWPASPPAPALATAETIGASFMREFLLPFEVASVVLLAALVGAIVVAFEERGERRRVLTLAEEVALRRTEPEPASQLSNRSGTVTPDLTYPTGAEAARTEEEDEQVEG